MHVFSKILRNEYYDSVTLMSLTARLQSQLDAEEIVVVMATEMNKEILLGLGFVASALHEASANDCIIGVISKTNDATILDEVVRQLKQGVRQGDDGHRLAHKTIKGALGDFDANLVVISTPGEYAAREAELALIQGLHVMIFSDNVSIQDEKRLKQMARDKGLLLMGPDCGTAIINGVGLCFANRVRAGNIGLVAASGTGLQEVSVLIHRWGGGISQAIGVGGRDLSVEIGGIMMLEGVRALSRDMQTEVIVLISKPPAREVQRAILDVLRGVEKPAIICFLDGGAPEGLDPNWRFVATLEAAATTALSLVGLQVEEKVVDSSFFAARVAEKSRKMHPAQRFMRGLYCGGTLCAEALSIARKEVHPLFSNVAKLDGEKLADPLTSRGHRFVDLGDDMFTRGRPHPMIDPNIRLARILQEAADPETAVLLLDFELGYGSHSDPVGVTLDTLRIAREIAGAEGRHLAIVGYVCGTDLDKQGFASQCEKLKSLGVIVATSNAHAVQLACKIVSGGA